VTPATANHPCKLVPRDTSASKKLPIDISVKITKTQYFFFNEEILLKILKNDLSPKFSTKGKFRQTLPQSL
jgi:hypothetical protein